MNKQILDSILLKHKAQPVGNAYIDIIVSRSNYKEFITDLILNNFKIESISWWELCENDAENKYGLGGPESVFYNNWFSELSIAIDDVETKLDDKIDQIENVVNIVENKTFFFADEEINFKTNSWLTPAIWLMVPEDWKYQYSA